MSTDEIVLKVVSHLEKSLIQDLKSSIKKELRSLIQEEFDELHKKIDNRFNGLEKTMDTWKNDFDEDRQKLRSISTNTGNTQTELQEVGITVEKLPKKLENRVDESVKKAVAEAVPEAVSSTFEIFGKKVRVIEKPRRFLSRLKFWR